MKVKALIRGRIVDEDIKLMEEKGCEVTKARYLPKTELEIEGEHDAIKVRSATRVTAEPVPKAKKIINALELTAS